ncbi:MAG: methyltransferase domain-containing protein [Anaerolineales bacterium]|jgi:ubiquinone/menaquinone biosynthesis C-methylase UbiE|nr:MAG: methyltransferase domain-containing protein [Anaerolineales bacterium]
MSDHHPQISEDRLFFLEKQELVVEELDASGYILDIGGGGEGIIGRLKGQQVIAIDSNRRELEEAPAGPLKIVMDATQLQLLDGSFGVVTAFFTLMYIKGDDHRKVFEEVFRVLVRGGRFLVWDAELPRRGDEKKDIIVLPLTVKLPGEDVSAVYGVRWPEDGRSLGDYVGLAREAGFEVVSQVRQDSLVHLDLRKP